MGLYGGNNQTPEATGLNEGIANIGSRGGEGSVRGSADGQSIGAQHQRNYSSFADSSTGCLNIGEGSQAGGPRLEAPDDFQKVQRRGSKPMRPQWVQRDPARNPVQFGIDRSLPQIALEYDDP
jgi:hypothetical protein